MADLDKAKDYGTDYKPEQTVYVIKKDGSKEAFNVQKVIDAVGKSAYRALTQFTDQEKKHICQYVVDKVNKLRMIKLILKMRDGNHVGEKEVHHYQTNKLTIKSPESFVANIDGEDIYDRKFEIEVIKDGIMLYYDRSLIDYLTK